MRARVRSAADTRSLTTDPLSSNISLQASQEFITPDPQSIDPAAAVLPRAEREEGSRGVERLHWANREQ